MLLDILKKRWKIYGAILLSVIVYSLMQNNSSNADAAANIRNDKINFSSSQTEQLSQSVNALNAFSLTPTLSTSAQKPVLIAQSSKNIAALNVRIAELEEQVRILRGQVDGLQFQLMQMQTFLERQQEDYEFRFNQLEGGGVKKTDAALQSNSDDAIVGAPQINILPINQDEGQMLVEGLELATPGQPLGSQPHDTSFSPQELVTRGDADAQYRAGFDALMRSDNEFAEGQFRQFIELFPTHPQAPDATNWLGELLINKGEYNEAAQILLDGFQSYSASSRAPDLLLKLGMALVGSNEVEIACRTFAEVSNRYPNISNALRIKLNEEMQKARC